MGTKEIYFIDGNYCTTKPIDTKIAYTEMRNGTRVIILKRKNTIINILSVSILVCGFVFMLSNGNDLDILTQRSIISDNTLVQLGIVNELSSTCEFNVEVVDTEGNTICKSGNVKPGESLGYLPALRSMEEGEHLVNIKYNIMVDNKIKTKQEDSIIIITNGG